MKTTIVLMVLVVMMFISTPLSVAEIDTSGLTDTQKAELALQAEKMKSDKPVVEKVNEWVNVGTAVGQALSSSAKELGIAVNDFIKTPAGKITTAVICWKVIGRDIVHFLLGSLLLIVFLSIWFYFFKKHTVNKIITYKEGKKDTVKYEEVENAGNWVLAYWIILLIGVVVSLLVVFC